MTSRPVTINLPEPLYQRLQERAVEANRSLEAELLDVVAMAVPDELDPDLQETLHALALLDDTELWRAARSHLPQEAATEMENLHWKRQREGLTESENETLTSLVQQYERYMLVRAQAAVLLQQRGHDISALLSPT